MSHRAIKPDAQAFDEIHVVTVPRYKTSGLSGDEWRISARVQFLRKGRVIVEWSCRDVETAAMLMSGKFLDAIDDGEAYYAGEEDFCDQEGCSDRATVTYRLKKEFCKQGHESDPDRIFPEGTIRRFCARHSTRGDCGLEDSDANYISVEGHASSPHAADKKESAFGGVIRLDQGDAS